MMKRKQKYILEKAIVLIFRGNLAEKNDMKNIAKCFKVVLIVELHL